MDSEKIFCSATKFCEKVVCKEFIVRAFSIVKFCWLKKKIMRHKYFLAVDAEIY